MNELIKYFGVILIIIAVGILGYYASEGGMIRSNTLLVTSLVLMIGGLVLHIILNRILD